MAVPTMRLRVFLGVSAVVDKFKMIRVNASSVLARVMDIMIIGRITEVKTPGHTVSSLHTLSIPDHSVASGRLPSSPTPTRCGGVYLRPETLL